MSLVISLYEAERPWDISCRFLFVGSVVHTFGGQVWQWCLFQCPFSIHLMLWVIGCAVLLCHHDPAVQYRDQCSTFMSKRILVETEQYGLEFISNPLLMPCTLLGLSCKVFVRLVVQHLQKFISDLWTCCALYSDSFESALAILNVSLLGI